MDMTKWPPFLRKYEAFRARILACRKATTLGKILKSKHVHSVRCCSGIFVSKFSSGFHPDLSEIKIWACLSFDLVSYSSRILRNQPRSITWKIWIGSDKRLVEDWLINQIIWKKRGTYLSSPSNLAQPLISKLCGLYWKNQTLTFTNMYRYKHMPRPR